MLTMLQRAVTMLIDDSSLLLLVFCVLKCIISTKLDHRDKYYYMKQNSDDQLLGHFFIDGTISPRNSTVSSSFKCSEVFWAYSTSAIFIHHWMGDEVNITLIFFISKKISCTKFLSRTFTEPRLYILNSFWTIHRYISSL